MVLDFDHVSGIKVMGISRMVANGGSLEALQEEIAKCVSRCANCHRRKTAHELVQTAAREAFASGRPLAGVLAGTDEVAARLDADAIGRLLDPAGYLGATDELIRRALRAHRAHRERGARAL